MIIIDVNGNKRDCAKFYPDTQWPGYIRVEYDNKVRKYHEWYPIKEFIKNNPELESMIKNAPKVAEDVVGVVSTSTKNSLTDKKKKWEKDIYSNFPVWISRGKGEGQTRTVLSNTHNTILVDKLWEVLPDNTSQYVITHNVHDPQIFGNTLPSVEVKKEKKKKLKK